MDRRTYAPGRVVAQAARGRQPPPSAVLFHAREGVRYDPGEALGGLQVSEFGGPQRDGLARDDVSASDEGQAQLAPTDLAELT